MPGERASVEISARSVEEAIELGLSQLGLERAQVEIEVINPGRSGLLGIGAQDAVVRLTALESRAEEPAAETSESAESIPEQTPASGSSITVGQTEIAELAARLLQGLIDHMRIRGKVVVRTGEDMSEEGETSPIVLDIVGRDLGVLIGRQGETLQALQYLTRLMLNKHLGRWEPVIVDVESYRARRRRLLRQLALRMAERAATSRRRVILEAMPAHERRVIHLALADHPHVTTKSIGEGEHRKVTIIPK